MSQRAQRRGSVSAIRRSLATTPRTSDDFIARSLDTTKWQFVNAKTGSGGGLAFTTTSMIDLVTSNAGGYQNDGAVAIYENVTPTVNNANTSTLALVTIPNNGSATFRIVTRMPVVASGLKGYEMVLDCGNGQLVCNVRNDSYGETQPYKSLANQYSTSPGTSWYMRFLTTTTAAGTRLAGKTWQLSASEPDSWAFDVVSTAGYSSGYVVLWAYPGAATSSYTWKVDSASVTNA